MKIDDAGQRRISRDGIKLHLSIYKVSIVKRKLKEQMLTKDLQIYHSKLFCLCWKLMSYQQKPIKTGKTLRKDGRKR